MAKRFNIADIRSAASALAEEDRVTEERARRSRGQRARVELERIVPRARSTRELSDGHVAALAESIAVLGLIEPIVLDRRLRLVAGGHRLAALARLHEGSEEVFRRHFAEGVPVWLMPFDAEQSPDEALAVEVAENEHRRDYTRDEARALAGRLRQAGYHDTPGRPPRGARALAPALQVVLGKSLRTVRRLLADERGDVPAATREPAPAEQAVRALGRLARALGAYRESVPAQLRREELQAVRRTVRELEAQVARALQSLAGGGA
jgi:ParB family chromosome partitioning protein